MKRAKYRERMKRNFDKRQNTTIPRIEVGDLVLVRKGLSNSCSNHRGPFSVVKTASQQGILKTVWYVGPNGTVESASIANVFKYHPRRDENNGGESEACSSS